MKTLDAPPVELMLVEDGADNTDPYNSGVHRALTGQRVEFLRSGRHLIGDLDTAFTEEELL